MTSIWMALLLAMPAVGAAGAAVLRTPVDPTPSTGFRK